MYSSEGGSDYLDSESSYMTRQQRVADNWCAVRNRLLSIAVETSIPLPGAQCVLCEKSAVMSVFVWTAVHKLTTVLIM